MKGSEKEIIIDKNTSMKSNKRLYLLFSIIFMAINNEVKATNFFKNETSDVESAPQMGLNLQNERFVPIRLILMFALMFNGHLSKGLQ